jgi:hypothetical protein
MHADIGRELHEEVQRYVGGRFDLLARLAQDGGILPRYAAHLIAECRAPLIHTPAGATEGASEAGAGATAVELQLEPEGEEEKQCARAARECALRAITQTTLHARASVLSPHIPALLCPVLTAAASMQRPDLCNTARSCAVLMAHTQTSTLLLTEILSTLSRLATAPSWRLRGGILPLLALLLYRGQFVEPIGAHAATARALLRSLMLDQQQEVREAAATVFAGFIRILGAPERALTLAWARTLSHKGKGLPLASRHAGVLALSSLVQLAPYDIPAWLPEVLELLSTFFGEQQPIKGVVVKTFADFKRTHTDNWAVQRERCR